jgi:hypothetical protein
MERREGVGKRGVDDTPGSSKSLLVGGENDLYERTGFPQIVQGKTGENWGES